LTPEDEILVQHTSIIARFRVEKRALDAHEGPREKRDVKEGVVAKQSAKLEKRVSLIKERFSRSEGVS